MSGESQGESALPDPISGRKLARIGIVGLGTIGARWAVAFAAAGLEVRAYDRNPERWADFLSIREQLAADLARLHGHGLPSGEIAFSSDLDAALQGVDFVQENAPENLEIKQELLPRIERAVDDEVVIASSSSALLVSELQRRCHAPSRIVLGHPFNPAHLMPLVEIVGGELTAPTAIERARGVYDRIGKKPVVLRREITGHLALRLMGAMWREAIALVSDGVASVEDVDRAFRYGPGPKWLLQGAFLSNHLNAKGMTEFLDRYGPTYEAIWADLKDARLDPATREAIVAGTTVAARGRSLEELVSARDRGVLEILKEMSAQED
jgi:carnitine 3-dehydrogenase